MQVYKVKVFDNGNTFWFNEYGQYHRLDGPAVERSNGDVEYWLNDVQYTEEEYNAKMNPEKTIEVNGHTYKLVK